MNYAVSLGLYPSEVIARAAGMYLNKERAAHWDGRNQQGERVASGVYIHHFRAGDYQATCKMVMRKYSVRLT